MIQWLYTESLCTLFQRLGRAARACGIEATGIYLVEQEHFDWYKAQKEARQKAKRKNQNQSGPSSKRRRTESRVAQASTSTDRVEEPGTDSDSDDSDNEESIPVPEAIPLATIKGSSKTYDHLPSRSGLSTEEYEKACMDAYINARLRGWCRREISDEYFQNNLCSKSSF